MIRDYDDDDDDDYQMITTFKKACHAWMIWNYDSGDVDEMITIWWLLKKTCHAWMNYDFIAER